MPMLKRNYGAPRKIMSSVKRRILEKKGSEKWVYNGGTERFKSIFIRDLKKKPLIFLENLNIKNPQIMFLGPGQGFCIKELDAYCNKINKKPDIDSFSLTDNLHYRVKEKIRNDYSANIAFERLNVKNSKYKFLENKYDLIIGAMSVGVHTKYPANALFTSSLMLKKGGRAYIQIDKLFKDITEKRTIVSLLKKYSFSKEEISSQKQILVLEKVFNRMLKSYNPNLEFNFSILNLKRNRTFKRLNIPEIYDSNAVFVEIERIK